MTRLLLVSTMLTLSALLPAAADAPVAVTAGANDTTGEAGVAVGGQLVVRLQVAGGSGHSWKLMSDAGPELSLGDQRIERSQTRALGAPQFAVFEFAAQTAGQKELTFGFFPAGASEETGPARSYVLTVTINE